MLMEIGRLTYDVEVKTVGDGKKVLNNRLAIPSGNNQTTFIEVVAWNSPAELIGKYFKKGYEIAVEGKLINKKKQITPDVETETVAIQVERVIFTHGNPKTDNMPDLHSESGYSDDDFLT